MLVRMKVCGTFWCVKVHFLSNPLHALLIKLVLCSINTVMAVKIILFQANSNLIRHLQFESCRIGKLPVQNKERKQNTHTNSSVIITMIDNLFCLLIDLFL